MSYYRANGRVMPWRQPDAQFGFDAYKILVSEMMLQQTQVSRVVPKYNQFLAHFPDRQTLARATLPEVLSLWSGLGYNRRAKYLWEAVTVLAAIPEPWTEADLVQLKGIGSNTARAVLAYAYNQQVVFVETNIRTVLIHYFFRSKQQVSDSELLALFEVMTQKAFSRVEPRTFYWAMMDYGTYLKATFGNASRQASVYTKQPAFHGSFRQLRGKIIKALLAGPQEVAALKQALNDERFEEVCAVLQQEQLIELQDNKIMLYNKA